MKITIFSDLFNIVINKFFELKRWHLFKFIFSCAQEIMCYYCFNIL